MNKIIERRDFLKTGAIISSGAFLSCAVGVLPSIDRPYRVGLIGAGWYGKSDLCRLIQVADVEVLAICDVDLHMLSGAQTLIASRQKNRVTPKGYGNYREMLASHQFDIILIGTPDHWHSLQAIESIKAGAHVYLQKPISVDVLEGDAILRAARAYGKVVQIGTQRRSTQHLINAKNQVLTAGMLGKISHVEMCCYYPMRSLANPSEQAVPEYFDYEMWVGPAPKRPFDGMPHRGWWRAFMEYSNGIMGDMCVHMFDTVRWLLDLSWPMSIESTGGIYVQKSAKSNTADTQHAIFRYQDLNCVWQHRSWGTAPDPDYPWAFFIYGENGTLKGDVYKYEFVPNNGGNIVRENVLIEKEKYPEDVTEKDIELHTAPATREQLRNFIYAIETESRPVADIEEGYISTACCIIANLSMKLKRPLKYDPIQKIIIDDSEATALLKRKYRGDWVHPADMSF